MGSYFLNEHHMKVSQPFLFDKLSSKTSRSFWRGALVRDVELLLNDAARSGQLHLDNYPWCKNSVLNFGLPSLSRQLPVNADALTIAHHIHSIIVLFEPRIDPRSIKVTPVVEKRQALVLTLLFDINGWSVIPELQAPISLRIALDYSCGAVSII